MTGSYPALRELITRLEGKDKKTCELALSCLKKANDRDAKLRAEIEKYKAISSKAIQEQANVRKEEQERCAKIAESWDGSFSESPYYSAEQIALAIRGQDK